MKYLKLKKELKKLAKEIRYWKSKRKLGNRGNFSLQNIETSVRTRKYEFRHRHIAYCQLRGRLRIQIEQPASDNLPNEKYIERIIEQHGETLRASAQGSI